MTTKIIETVDSLYDKILDDTPDGQDPISEEEFYHIEKLQFQ
jgi:hypothetical protein